MQGVLAFGVTSILNTKQFSWVFLVDWILIQCVAIFILFYVSRLIAWLITLLVGTYLWHRHRVILKVGSIKFSLLGGRFFFKRFVYIGENESFCILQGYLTWQFWYRHVRRAAYLRGNTDRLANAKLPTRLTLTLYGFEWFAYNRSAIYDELAKKAHDARYENSESGAKEFHASGESQDRFDTTSSASHRGLTISKELSYTEQKILSFLPLDITFHTCAAILGNGDTQSLLVIRTDRATALVDISPPSNVHDRYMMQFSLTLKNPKVELLPNGGYKGRASVFAAGTQPLASLAPKWYQLWNFKSQKTKSLKGMSWPGLSRYYSAQHSEQQIPKYSEEYAKVTTLLECDLMTIEYQFDDPGPSGGSESDSLNLPYSKGAQAGIADESRNDFDKGPLFKINLRITNASFNYGPWAERQRVELFEVFFPTLCVDSTPFTSPAAGQPRVYRSAETFVEFEGQCVVRVPIREQSKDQEYFAKQTGENNHGQRSFGWIDISAVSGTTLSYAQPMVPNLENSWLTTFMLTMKRVEVRTSVTHGPLLFADHHSLLINQQSPLKWNGLQQWNIEHNALNLRSFVLREHVSLVNDLFTDFSVGPVVPYSRFVPTIYKIHWNIRDVAFYLNVNSQNIINNPISLSENVFLVLSSDILTIDLVLPRDNIVDLENISNYSITTPCLRLHLSVPSWHTFEGFMDSSFIAKVDNFVVRQSAALVTNSKLGKPDTMIFDIKGENFTFLVYGFVIEYLMVLRGNYFGHKYHFQTTEEFLQKNKAAEPELFSFSRQEPDTDVSISCLVTNTAFVFPGYIYSARDNLSLNVNELSVECRFTNYYMDLQAHFIVVNGYFNRDMALSQIKELSAIRAGERTVFLSELVVHGHRMFGLPPSEPTYHCKWDMDIDDLSICCQIDTLLMLKAIAQSFHYTFKDSENKPSLAPQVLHDVTFVSVNLESLHVEVKLPMQGSLGLECAPVRVRLNDFANLRYSQKVNFDVPFVRLFATLDDQLVADLRLSIYLTSFVNNKDSIQSRLAQQRHITLHDSLFHRCPFLLEDNYRYSEVYETSRTANDTIDPTSPIPDLPPQLNSETAVLLEPLVWMLKHTEFTEYASENISVSRQTIYGTHESIKTNVSSLNIKNRDCRQNTFVEETTRCDFLPPKSWERYATDFSLPEQEQDTGPRAVPWTPEAPSLSAHNPEIEYDAKIVEIPKMEGMILPQAIQVLETLTGISNNNIEAIFDDLQADLIFSLETLDFPECCKRLRVACPVVDIKFGELSPSSTRDEIQLVDDYIFLSISNLSLMYQETKDMKPQEGQNSPGEVDNYNISKLVRAGFDDLVIAIRKGNIVPPLQPNVAHFQISKAACWWAGDKDQNASCGDALLDNVDIFLIAEHVNWLCDFLLCLIEQSILAIDTSAAMRHKSSNSMAALAILAVAEYGDLHGIEDDPYVLSRPSSRLMSVQHVRFKNSWRIMVRLRYLLQKIPRSELSSTERDMVNGKTVLPEDAKERVLRIFNKWRSWEHVEGFSTSKIFSLFKNKIENKDLLSLLGHAKLDVKNISLRLSHGHLDEDFASVDGLRAELNTKEHLQATQLELTVQLRVLKLYSTKNTIIFAANIQDTLKRVRSRLSEVFSPRKSTPVSGSVPPSGGAKVLQCNVNILIHDSSATVNFAVIALELQNHSLQLSFAIENRGVNSPGSFFASGFCKNDSSALRIYRLDISKELVDYLLETPKVAFAANTTTSGVKVWTSVSVSNLSLALNATLSELLDATDLFIEQDLPLFANFSSVDHPTTKDRKKASYIFSVDLNVANIAFHLTPIKKFSFELVGQDYSARFRETEHSTFFVDTELDNLVITVIHDGQDKLGNFRHDGVKFLLRYQYSLSAARELFYSVERVSLETTSVVLLLEYIRNHQVITKFKEALSSRKSKPDVSPAAVDSKKPANFAFNFHGSIDEVLLILPLQTTAFRFVFSGIKLDIDTFRWLDHINDTARSVATRPPMGSVSLKSFKTVLVRGTEYEELLSLQLTASHNRRRGEQSIHVTSDHFAVTLSPQSTSSIVRAYSSLGKYVEVFRGTTSAAYETSSSKDPKSKDSFRDLLKIRAAIALSNFSFTWSTGHRVSNGEKFVIGYDLLQVNLKKLRSRMDLRGFYVKTMLDKPQAADERVNSAILPHVELIGILLYEEDKKLLYMHLKGQSLRIDILPSIAPLVVGILSSFEYAFELAESSKSKIANKIPTAQLPKSPTSRGWTGGYSVHMESKFDKAVFSLWESALKDEIKDETAIKPSLELFSPTVDILTEYICSEVSQDNVLLTVNIGRSVNVLYPKAIVEVKNIFKYAERLMIERRSRRAHKDIPAQVNDADATSKATSDPKISWAKSEKSVLDQLLQDLSLNAEIHFDTQELTLNSMPFANLAATASTQAVDLFLTSPTQGLDRYVALSGVIKNLQVYLQHVYSRETSGYVSIANTIANLTHKHSGNFIENPIEIGIKVSSPKFDVSASKFSDWKLFRDIWGAEVNLIPRRKSSSAASRPNLRESGALDFAVINTFALKYRKAMETVPSPWLVNLSIQSLEGCIDFGQSTGRSILRADKLWLAMMKTSHIDQFLVVGIDHLSVQSTGRIAGYAVIRGTELRVNTLWESASIVPCIQAAFSTGELSLLVSLDYHPFLMAYAQKLQLGLANVHEVLDKSVHKLLVTFSVSKIGLLVTSLIAAHLLDIQGLLKSIDMTQADFYQSTLPSTGYLSSLKPHDNPRSAMKKAARSLSRHMMVRVNAFIENIQLSVFPTEFTDGAAMHMHSQNVEASFSQVNKDGILESDLNLALSSYTASVLTLRQNPNMDTSKLEPEAFGNYVVGHSSGTVIAQIPHCRIVMTTQDNLRENPTVDYVFESTFGGAVVIRWNLGAVTFVKELFEAHSQAWEAARVLRDHGIRKEKVDRSKTSQSARDTTTYVAKKAPIIVIPQLHDMGDATPPIEWIGLNRQKLPAAVHRYVIRTLNEFVQEMEAVYQEILGHS